MSQSTPTPVRVAYIRTTTHKDKNPWEIFELLNSKLRQTSLTDQEYGLPRHRFVFGATNSSDANILDLLIRQSPFRTQKDILAAAGEPPSGTHIFPVGRGLCRADLEMHISQSRATSSAGTNIVNRCMSEGIATRISGDTDEECDIIMLEGSNYLIDFLTSELLLPYEDWFRLQLRMGEKQDNMLTNPKYNVNKHDASKGRLQRRYWGYSWQASSGGMRGNGEWHCSRCRGKCKRGKCPVAPHEEAKKQGRKFITTYEKADDERKKSLFKRGDERWRDLSTKETLYYYRGQWKSVDTFSGD